MSQEVWETSVDGSHISVAAPKGTVSRISVTVILTDEDACGYRCCDERIPATDLGSVGAAVVAKLRSHLDAPKIYVSPDGFKVCLASQTQAEKARRLIDELAAAGGRKVLALAS
jgi:hypothetical protein